MGSKLEIIPIFRITQLSIPLNIEMFKMMVDYFTTLGIPAVIHNSGPNMEFLVEGKKACTALIDLLQPYAAFYY